MRGGEAAMARGESGFGGSRRSRASQSHGLPARCHRVRYAPPAPPVLDRLDRREALCTLVARFEGRVGIRGDRLGDPEAVFLMRATHIERAPDFKRGLAMPDATR